MPEMYTKTKNWQFLLSMDSAHLRLKVTIACKTLQPAGKRGALRAHARTGTRAPL